MAPTSRRRRTRDDAAAGRLDRDAPLGDELAAEIDTLIVFAVVARLGSFTAAAAALGITQPSISDRMRRLEQRLGEPAFERHGRGVRLTASGEAIRPLAERALAIAQETGQLFAGLSRFDRGVVRGAASTTIAGYVLPDAIARLIRARPAVEVDIRVGNTADVASAVERGDVAWALVEGPVDEARFAVRRFRDDELVLIVPPRHAWARRKRAVPAAALADEAFIAREIGSGTGAVVDRALSRAGVRLRPSVRLADSHGVAETVASGGGIGIVSALVAAPLVAARRVVRVAIDGVSLVRPFSLVQLPGRSVGTLDAELLRLVGA